MSELIAVIDESGPDGDPLKHISVIVSDLPTINNNLIKLPSNFTRMANLSEKEKLPLLHRLDFSGNIYVGCMHVSLKQLRNKIDERIVKKRSNKIKRNVTRIVGVELRSRLNNAIWEFVRKNKYEIDRLVFEIDNDILKEYLEISGLNTKPRTNNHKIADCIAHANYKGWSLKNVIESNKNFQPNFHDSVLSQVNKKIK